MDMGELKVRDIMRVAARLSADAMITQLVLTNE
jgi:hypothetical protein